MSNIIEKTGSAHDSTASVGRAGDCITKKGDCARCEGNCTRATERGPTRRRRADVKAGLKGKRARVAATPASRAMSLATMASEYVWLWDVRHGLSAIEIAVRDGVTVSRVRFGISRAQALERNCSTEATIRIPPLIPLFPLGPLTPQSACRHNGPIEIGSVFCCVVCHCSGIDDHPGLQRDPLTDPAPEPKPKPAPTSRKTSRETRKQRRQRLYGTPSLMSEY
jgi:hypothetical protein